MGNEVSHEQVDPNTPPRTLPSRDLKGVAEYINDGRPKRIVILTGAGISTAAGIPDFRSPETGLYANLARLNLPYAEAVFDISYFRTNPEPFYVLAKELYPGQFYPTVSHSFIKLMDDKFMLHQLFTQNIDCLERKAGVPGDKIVEAHGSFANQHCIECHSKFPDDQMKEMVEGGFVPQCVVPQCNGLVKPDIVFFGESLPPAFREKSPMVGSADLVIVMGTSLSVAPFSSLPQFAREDVPRVLFNKDQVGDFGSRLDDVVVLGDCDDGVRKLCDELGWRDELEELWRAAGGDEKEKEAARLKNEMDAMTKDQLLEAEIEKITGEVEATLKVSEAHHDRVSDTLNTSKKPKVDEEARPTVGVETEKEEVLPMEEKPVALEKTEAEVPANMSSLNTKTIPDLTLPQYRPKDELPPAKI